MHSTSSWFCSCLPLQLFLVFVQWKISRWSLGLGSLGVVEAESMNTDLDLETGQKRSKEVKIQTRSFLKASKEHICKFPRDHRKIPGPLQSRPCRAQLQIPISLKNEITAHSTSSDSVTFCKSFLGHLVSRWLWEPTYAYIISIKAQNCVQDRNTQKQSASWKNHAHIHTYTVQGASTYEGVRCAQTIEPNAARNAGTLLSLLLRIDDLGIREVPEVLNGYTECIVEGHSILWNTTRSVFILASLELFLQNPSQWTSEWGHHDAITVFGERWEICCECNRHHQESGSWYGSHRKPDTFLDTHSVLSENASLIGWPNGNGRWKRSCNRTWWRCTGKFGRFHLDVCKLNIKESPICM